MSRYALLVALVLAAGACQISSTPVAAPVVSQAPHTAPAAAALQPGEVGPGLQACPGSGPIATYVTTLQASNPTLAAKFSSEWKSLQSAGAEGAAVAVYAADPSACSAELAATGAVKSEASVVVAFGDEGQADRAWQAGILGFAPPAPGENPPGVIRGNATGLGDESWTYTNVPVQLASWRRSVFVALVVATNLDGAAFKAATAAINARLN